MTGQTSFEIFVHSVWQNLITLDGTSEHPIRIEEIFFGDRCKYHPSRLLSGNQQALQFGSDTYSACNAVDEDRGFASWVLGICTRMNNLRLILVPDRLASKLL